MGDTTPKVHFWGATVAIIPQDRFWVGTDGIILQAHFLDAMAAIT